eukprot:3426063-Prymnesium_polylepis.1
MRGDVAASPPPRRLLRLPVPPPTHLSPRRLLSPPPLASSSRHLLSPPPLATAVPRARRLAGAAQGDVHIDLRPRPLARVVDRLWAGRLWRQGARARPHRVLHHSRAG